MNNDHSIIDINEMKQAILASESLDNSPRPPLPFANDDSNYVFISYPHHDYKCVYCDLLDLYENGVKYWYDNGLHPGENWEKEVSERISDPRCSGIVYYLSENAFTQSMAFEIAHAMPKNGNAKSYFSINISGRSAYELLLGSNGAKSLPADAAVKILTVFDQRITYIKRKDDPADNSHIKEVISTLKERFNVVKQTSEERRALELLMKAKQLEAEGRVAEALEMLKRILELGGVSSTLLCNARLSAADICEKNEKDVKLEENARDHIEAAATLGSATALYKLAQVLDAAGDYKTAAKHYLRAAELGVAEAQYKIGDYCLRGVFGVKQDSKAALYWFGKASDGGHRAARGKYDKLKAQLECIDKPDSELTAADALNRAHYYDSTGNYKTAAEYYLKAAELGDTEAQYKIADYHLRGIFDVEKDSQKARYWFGKAADGGHRLAREKYESLRIQLDGLEKSDDELSAAEASQKAKYYDSISDYRTGAKYYLLAAELGDPEAQYKIADYCLRGVFGVKQDSPAALAWLGRAADGSHPYARNKYLRLKAQLDNLSRSDGELSAAEAFDRAQYYDSIGDYRSGVKYYLLAAELGNPEAQYRIADYHLRGAFGVEKDRKKALYWFGEAADRGHRTAREQYEKLKNAPPEEG